jgi:protein gp37
MGDWMTVGHSMNDRNQVWMQMFNNPKHTYLTLTKQPADLFAFTKGMARAKGNWPIDDIWPDWIYNGLTITNQQDADEKLPTFLQIPGKKWLSIEPMTGPVDLERYLINCEGCGNKGSTVIEINYDMQAQSLCNKACIKQGEKSSIDGVILGGMTGHLMQSNPMKLEWAEQIVSDCQGADVPVFVKQIHIDGRLSKEQEEWPGSLRVRQLAWGQ